MKPMRKIVPAPPETIERFWGKVSKVDGCWDWTGSKAGIGHGIFYPKGGGVSNGGRLAHRWIFFQANPDADQSFLVCHKCDNPACVRLEHLFLGTQQQNVEDMVKKGRRTYRSQLGSANYHSKLTDNAVSEIRRLKKLGISYRLIAKQFGICNTTVYDISNGHRWGHTKEEGVSS